MLLGVRVDLPVSKSESPTAFAGPPAPRRPPLTGPTSLGATAPASPFSPPSLRQILLPVARIPIAFRRHTPPRTMSEHAPHDPSSSRPSTSGYHIPTQTNGIKRSFTQLNEDRYEDPRYASFSMISRMIT